MSTEGLFEVLILSLKKSENITTTTTTTYNKRFNVLTNLQDEQS
jgi:hypothetical protein